MPRRTLDQYSKGHQAEILAQLHPGMMEQRPHSPTTRPAKPLKRVNTAAAQAKPATDTGKGSYPFTIWLDYRVPSLNTISGRWGKVAANRVASQALAAALPLLGRYPRQGAGRLHLIYTSYVCHLRDADNPTTKFMNDALRAAGLLRNDDRTCMALTYNLEVRVRKRALEGTKVMFVEDPL